MNKLSADLGDANIPKIFLQPISPYQLTTLYWREQSLNPENVTVEIWKTEEDKFLIFTGDFSDGEWGQEDVFYYGEYENIQDALADSRAYFVLDGDNEVFYELQNTGSKVSRLLKKRAS